MLSIAVTGVGCYAATPTTPPVLGTTVTASSCYVPLWGRVFTVTTSFAVLAPAYFRPFSSYVDPNSNDQGETSSYRRATVTGRDTRPLWAFKADLTTAASASSSLYSSIATNAATAAATAGAAAMQFWPLTSAPSYPLNPAYVAPGLAGTIRSGFALNSIATFTSSSSSTAEFTTSFIPDYLGTYTVSITITDNCPGRTDVTPPRTFTVTSAPAACPINSNSAASATVFAVDQLTSAQLPGSVNRQWTNRTNQFGNHWLYGGSLSAPSAAQYVSQPNIAITYQNQFPTMSGGSASLSSASLSLSSSSTNQGALVVVGQSSNTYFSSTGLSIQLSVSAGGFQASATGTELRVGCLPNPTSFNTGTLTADKVTWFKSISAADGWAGGPLLAPAACFTAATTAVVFYVPAPFGSQTGSFSISNLAIITHPSVAFRFVTSTCVLPYWFQNSANAQTAQVRRRLSARCVCRLRGFGCCAARVGVFVE